MNLKTKKEFMISTGKRQTNRIFSLLDPTHTEYLKMQKRTT